MSFKENSIEWNNDLLGDICTIKGGKRLPKGKQLSSNKTKHPYIKVKDMGENKYICLNSGFEYLDDETFESISRYIVNENDLIISIVGTIGLIGLIDKSLESANLTENCVKLIDIKNVTNDFLYYYLKSPIGGYEIKKGVVGSTQPKLPIYNIQKIAISYPSISEQKAIAKVLSDLDEKIETNNKINKKLEEMAQTIFKQWFVDFEFPNEYSKPYKSSGGEMVESELGMIPKGWNIKKLSELADMKNGVNYGRNQEGEKVKVVNVRDFDGSLVVNDKKLDSVFLLQKQINDYRLQKYDTVIVRSAKPGETLLVNDDNLKVYSGFTIRIRPKDYNIKLYVFYCIRNSIRQLENSSNGTIFKNLNQQLLGKVNVIEPTIEIINKYNDFIKTIIDKIYIVNEEINRLTDLRNTLLPKLMSGEIRVPIN